MTWSSTGPTLWVNKHSGVPSGVQISSSWMMEAEEAGKPPDSGRNKGRGAGRKLLGSAGWLQGSLRQCEGRPDREKGVRVLLETEAPRHPPNPLNPNRQSSILETTSPTTLLITGVFENTALRKAALQRRIRGHSPG